MAVDPRSGSGLAGDTLLTRINSTGDQHRADVSNFYSTTFVYGMSYQVSDMLIKVLQDYFQSNDLTTELNTELAKVNKEVVVLDQFTPDTVTLPQIIVSSLPADHIPLSFGNRIGQETFTDSESSTEEIYDVYGGDVLLNTTLELYDSGKPNVHRLADIVFLGLMQYVSMRLGNAFMTLDLSRVRFANATRVTGTGVGGELYRIPITFGVRSEWRQYFKHHTVDVSAIRNSISEEDTYSLNNS